MSVPTGLYVLVQIIPGRLSSPREEITVNLVFIRVFFKLLYSVVFPIGSVRLGAINRTEPHRRFCRFQNRTAPHRRILDF